MPSRVSLKSYLALCRTPVLFAGGEAREKSQIMPFGRPGVSEYPYGCAAARRTGRVGGMTTHRASKNSAEPGRPVERAVVAGLVLAVGAGLAWIGGMIYTIAGWAG